VAPSGGLLAKLASQFAEYVPRFAEESTVALETFSHPKYVASQVVALGVRSPRRRSGGAAAFGQNQWFGLSEAAVPLFARRFSGLISSIYLAVSAACNVQAD